MIRPNRLTTQWFLCSYLYTKKGSWNPSTLHSFDVSPRGNFDRFSHTKHSTRKTSASTDYSNHHSADTQSPQIITFSVCMKGPCSGYKEWYRFGGINPGNIATLLLQTSSLTTVATSPVLGILSLSKYSAHSTSTGNPLSASRRKV